MRNVIVIVVALVGLARVALAQDAAAEVLFQDGDRLMRKGKLAEACDAFEASNRIEPRTGTLIRLGDCREKRGQLASAWSAYADASARAKDPAKKQVADAKVAALGPRLSKLTIKIAQPVAELAVTRDGAPVDKALWGRAVPVDGGQLVLRATALGFQPWAQTVAVPVEGGDVTIEVPKLADAATTIAPRNPIVDPGLVTHVVAPSQEPSGLPGRRKLAIGVGVAGVAVVGVGVWAGLSASGLEDDAHALCAAVVCTEAVAANDALDRARTRATLANLAYGVGGAAIAAAAILWFTGGRAAPERVAVTPVLAPGAAGVAAAVRF